MAHLATPATEGEVAMPKRQREDVALADGGDPPLKRNRIAPFGPWVAGIERRIRRVHYQGDPVKAAGSKFVEARFGPGSYMPRANDANAKRPSGIRAARVKYPRCYFKAGHMLNCNLGGNGKNPKNLTILRSTANTSMTKHDNAIARGCEHLDRSTKRYMKRGWTRRTFLAASACASQPAR
jgi:hypothetical protein